MSHDSPTQLALFNKNEEGTIPFFIHIPSQFDLTCNSPQLAAGSPYVLSSERERAN
jgi:hypothetical protein